MSGPCILIVDDDRNDCLVLKRVLTDEGYDVDTAYDALSALKLFGEQTHDLVILIIACLTWMGWSCFRQSNGNGTV